MGVQMTQDEQIRRLKVAVLELLDTHGALSGGSHQLEGYGLSEELQQELWQLGQELLQEKEALEWT
jgi:hypothetical protein